MFYDESINTKLTNYLQFSCFVFFCCRFVGFFGFLEHTKHICIHSVGVKIHETMQVSGGGLKPSRQCSCRLTHTDSYTVCQVQNLTRFSEFLLLLFEKQTPQSPHGLGSTPPEAFFHPVGGYSRHFLEI